MPAASQLPGRGPTDVDVAPVLHINKKSGDDDDELRSQAVLTIYWG